MQQVVTTQDIKLGVVIGLYLGHVLASERHDKLIEQAICPDAERRSFKYVYSFQAAPPATEAAAATEAAIGCKDITVDASRFSNPAGNPFAHCLDCRQLGPAPDLAVLRKGKPTACLLPFSRNSDGQVFVAVLTLDKIPANKEVSFDYGDAYLQAFREMEQNQVQIKQEVLACPVVPQVVQQLQQLQQLCDQLPDAWQRDLAQQKLSQLQALFSGSQGQQQLQGPAAAHHAAGSQPQDHQQQVQQALQQPLAQQPQVQQPTEDQQPQDHQQQQQQQVQQALLQPLAQHRQQALQQPQAQQPQLQAREGALGCNTQCWLQDSVLVAIDEARALAELMQLLSSDSPDDQLVAARAFGNHAAESYRLKQQIAAGPGVLARLAQLLRVSSEGVQQAAATALCDLAMCCDIVKQRIAAEPGALTGLVQLLSSSSVDVQYAAAEAISTLTQHIAADAFYISSDVLQQVAATPGALTELQLLLGSNTPGLQFMAAQTLQHLAAGR
jgi:hypothetical protein